jgi:hydroxyethylthiazole kinase-like uncharacterized protein yjeF
VPSGISGDTGALLGPTVRADSTLCLGALKLAALFFPSGPAFGKVGYSPIGFNEKDLVTQPSRLSMYTWDDALDHLPLKTWRTHKYSAGKVLVIAGSRGMHGAAALCASAALRAGAGLVRAAVPGGIYHEVAHHLLEVIGTPIGENAEYHFTSNHIDSLAPWIEWAGSIVIGPGLGKHPDTLAFLRALQPLLTGRRVIVDGDALALFAIEERDSAERTENGTEGKAKAAIENKPESEIETSFTPVGSENATLTGRERFILTPHVGEFRRIGGLHDDSNPLTTIESARALAKRLGLSLVVKGPATTCVRATGEVMLSASGNPGMATAGTGDVLAGIMGRLLSVISPEEAAPLAVYLHGRAGEAARRDRGTSGMTASDLILYLPLAIKELEDALSLDDDDEE